MLAWLPGMTHGQKKNLMEIGILDIFGFEHFDRNGCVVLIDSRTFAACCGVYRNTTHTSV